MRLLRYFFILLVGITAVSCSSNTNNSLPTQVPTAAPLAGPPGTNKLDAPWKTTVNPALGLSIDHPQDWSGNNTDEALYLSPVTIATEAENNIPAGVSVFNEIDADSAIDIVTTLESLISDPELGPSESMTQVSAPTAVSINNYEAAVAQFTLLPPPFVLPEENPEGLSLDTFQDPVELHLYIVALRQNDRTVIFTGSVPSEFSKDYLPVFESIVKTIQILPPETE